ncbi:hypothetical protein FQA39_LY16945 [Lamprigera yunnana]|nr:hypothetical protein FQA39_LY16945 [Lamprigera yunnana]
MKLIFVLLLITFEAQCLISSKNLKLHADFCIERYGLDEIEILKIHNSDNLSTDNSNYLIFIVCYWKRIGYLSRNGELNFSAIWQTYFEAYRKRFTYEESKKKLELLIAKCDNVNGNTPALKAINMNICITS